MIVLIQHALDTGRYHPAYYRWAPLPGGADRRPGAPAPARYKSGGHHTEGFESLDAAMAAAQMLAVKLGANVEEGVETRMVESAGPDILFLGGLHAAA